MEISIEIAFRRIRIRIDGIIHLSLPDKELKIQSWINNEKSYSIEYYFENCSVLCEYSTQQKWAEILGKLEEKGLI